MKGDVMRKMIAKCVALLLLLAAFVPLAPAGAAVTVAEPGFAVAELAAGLANPQDITFFQAGGLYGSNLFVTEYDADAVTKIPPSGGPETLSTDVDYAVAILFGYGAFGNFLYASESYSADGNIVRVFPDGATSVFARGIASPLDMAWGSGGAFGSELYVSSANANKIVRVDASGRVADFAVNLDRPSVLAFSPGDAFGDFLYVTNTDDGQIVRVAPDGSHEVFVTGLKRPIGLAFGHNSPFGEYLYVSEKETGSILKVTAAGVVSTFAAGLVAPVEIHFSHGGLYGNDMLIAESDAGRISRITSLGAPRVDISPLAGDVGRTPFTFTFTISDPQGIGTLADFRFFYNGVDATAGTIDALIAAITHWDETGITVTIPNVVLPVGTHTVEIRLVDTDGHHGYGRVVYTVPPPRLP